jgi:hypothetical protein
MTNRLQGYDFIRSLSIICIFLYHIINRQELSFEIKYPIGCFAGFSLSLLGFISAAFSQISNEDYGVYILKRLTRIYIPLFLCLTVVLILQNVVGYAKINQHTALHFLGASLFFDVFHIVNKSSIGGGLWYITTVLMMYFMLPSFRILFYNKNKTTSLILIIALAIILNFTLSGVENFFTVLISYCLGVYFFSNNYIETVLKIKFFILFGLSLFIFGIALASIIVFGGFHPVTQFIFSLGAIIIFPFLFKLSRFLPKQLIFFALVFGPISFEFYILHFYFINEGLESFRLNRSNLFISISISFVITLILAFFISFFAKNIRNIFLKQVINKGSTG